MSTLVQNPSLEEFHKPYFPQPLKEPPASKDSASGEGGGRSAAIGIMLVLLAIYELQGTTAQMAAKMSELQQSLANKETEEMAKLNPDDITGDDQEKAFKMNQMMVQMQQIQTKYKSLLTPIEGMSDRLGQQVNDFSNSSSFEFKSMEELMGLLKNLAGIMG